MDKDKKDIIELHPERTDEGEIVYTKKVVSRSAGSNFAVKVLGVAVGVAIFLVILFFFVYVLLPIAAILIIWSILKGLFGRRR